MVWLFLKGNYYAMFRIIRKRAGLGREKLDRKDASSYLLNIDVFYKTDLLEHPRFIKLRKDMNLQ